MTPILAQLAPSYTFASLAISVIVIAGVIGIVYVILKQCNITIPWFIVAIFWILVACFVGIFAIRLLTSM